MRKVISRQNHNTQHHGSTHRPFSNYTPLSYFPRLGQFYNILRLLKKTTGRFYASQTTKLVARESRVNFTWYQQVIMLLHTDMRIPNIMESCNVWFLPLNLELYRTWERRTGSQVSGCWIPMYGASPSWIQRLRNVWKHRNLVQGPLPSAFQSVECNKFNTC